MEDIWKRARVFAEEAAKKSQALSRSTKISDIVSETAKKSKELALEASKKADELKIAALKQADQFKSLSDIIPPQISSLSIGNSSASASASASEPSEAELQKFGVTDDLRDFVKGLTANTFQNFPIQDEPQTSDVPTTVSNVQKDLSEWQEKHALIVLMTVKEISRLRYELCPRVMKERKFWKIYFTLVNTHVAPYEKLFMEEVKLKIAEQKKDDEEKQTPIVGGTHKSDAMEKNLKGKTSASSLAEQDLDKFLLGDFEDSDEGPDDGDGSFDDDFDKIDNSDVEDEKTLKNMKATKI